MNSGQIFNTIIIPYAPGAAAPRPSFRSRTESTNVSGANSTSANAIRNQLFHPTVNRDLALDGIQFRETVNIGEAAMPASAFPGGVRPAGVKVQGFTNYDAFPFNRAMLDGTSFQRDNFNTFNIALEQSAWRDARGQDRLGLELVYHFEATDRDSSNQFFSQGNGNHVRLDPNVALPDGSPNPNVGRP